MRSSTAASMVSYVGFLIIIAAIHNCFCNGNGSSNINNTTVVCRETEMQALLKFKQDLIDPSNRLSSWAGKDCCQWTGVVCDNFTSHVHEIHLRNPYELGEDYDPYEGKVEAYLRHQLGGKINPSLLDLKHLHHLDLSFNDFGNIKIPSFIGSIPTLRYLNLTRARFGGSIPPELGNLTRIRSLGLGCSMEGVAGLRGDNLEWLSRLVSLQHLDMQFVNLSKASNWLKVTNMLPSLVELHLSHCQLKLVSPPININFTSLAILDLSANPFNSFIPGWIFNLNRLVSLDISHSNFHGPLPSGFQNMTSLRVFDASNNYLNASLPMGLLSLSGLISLRLISLRLGGNNFQTGPIPIGIENMTNLRDLDLGFNSFNSTLPNSLFTLSRLEHLNLEFNLLQGVISSAIGSMTSITSLRLQFNQFEGRIPISLGELCGLKIIDLSANNLGGDISEVFKCFSRCKSIRLEKLDLRLNFLQGHLPNELGQFKNLAYLLLTGNNISGPIPTSLGKLSSLKRFDISQNRFNGTLPESLGQLAMLEDLCTHNNLLQGSIVADIHFANLTKLKIIIASGNNFSLEASDSWVPPFQLYYLELRSWRVGPQFPMWLRFQKSLQNLDISNAGISDSIPTWFWSKASHLLYLNLSCNQISGETPRKLGIDGGDAIIDLRSNSFKGPVPRIFPNVKFLDLSNNFFLGSVNHFLCDRKSKTDKSLEILLLKNNRLSGRIPNCWKHWKSLKVIKLDNNNLHGFIPPSIGHLTSLKSLHLRHNNLSGELPQSLQHCTMLWTINLAENGLSGSIPTWMGNSFSQLIVLNLRSNKFQGLIPYELCRMVLLQILDLSHNNISGSIPICFQNFEAMVEKTNSTDLKISTMSSESWDASYQDVESIVIKAQQLEYSTTLALVKSMDLSVNNLSGEIPEGLTKLVELQSFNLSRNRLTGRIPYDIGDMKQLESLDFSRNQLCGGIPSSLSNLTYLSHLNLSYNNLIGRIPLSTQIQGLDDSSFVGNNLCGPPLTNCSASRKIPKMEPRNSEEEEGFPKELFLASLALGFGVGFWTILGPLLFNMTWRIAYFRLLDAIGCNFSNFIFKCRYIFNN